MAWFETRFACLQALSLTYKRNRIEKLFKTGQAYLAEPENWFMVTSTTSWLQVGEGNQKSVDPEFGFWGDQNMTWVLFAHFIWVEQGSP